MTDIEFTIKENNEYFIGPIISLFTEEDDISYYEVIDGQQRLTTTYMIYHIMHKIITNENTNNPNDRSLAGRIHSKLETQLYNVITKSLLL